MVMVLINRAAVIGHLGWISTYFDSRLPSDSKTEKGKREKKNTLPTLSRHFDDKEKHKIKHNIIMKIIMK